jgi:hypothetical protein
MEITKSITSTMEEEAASSHNIPVSNYTVTWRMITFSRPTSVQTCKLDVQYHISIIMHNSTAKKSREEHNLVFI